MYIYKDEERGLMRNSVFIYNGYFMKYYGRKVREFSLDLVGDGGFLEGILWK